MLKKLFLFLLVISTISFATAINDTSKDAQPTAITIQKQAECEKLLASNATVEEIKRSGCCSWHGGVCGCSNGRAACCDGTLSPSCGCD